MTTIDDLYTQLAFAKKEHAPLAAALEARKAEWRTALTQLGLGEKVRHGVLRSVRSVPIATDAKPALPTKTYAVGDLPGLAIARLKAQQDHDASAGIVAAISTSIQAAIAAKGA